MSDSVIAIATQIERIVHPRSFRGTPYAQFQRPDGYFLAEAWFETGKPMLQIRSSTDSHEDAATVMQAISMAVTWQQEQIDAGRHIPIATEASR